MQQLLSTTVRMESIVTAEIAAITATITTIVANALDRIDQAQPTVDLRTEGGPFLQTTVTMVEIPDPHFEFIGRPSRRRAAVWTRIRRTTPLSLCLMKVCVIDIIIIK